MAKMNSQKMRKLLEERLTGADWSFLFDREKIRCALNIRKRKRCNHFFTWANCKMGRKKGSGSR